jgi:hypothetical protein
LLQISAAAHVPHSHVPVHVRVPGVPHDIVHDPLVPCGHANPSSVLPSQSSSTLLQTSAAVHAPQTHVAEHVREPGVAHVVEHEPLLPCRHPKSSSVLPSQSSSTLLQISVAAHAPQTHVAEHVRVPGVPHVVVQDPLVPCGHPKPSSVLPSQSSSTLLQISAAAHAPHAHVAEHVREPAVPHVVVHDPVLPWRQPKSSSVRPSQSSSTLLHVSVAAHAPHAHVAEHVRVPGVPHDIVHDPVLPWRQPKSSSVRPSQSSSRPLQASTGGVQAPQTHVAEQAREPVLPQEAVQEPVLPWTHPSPLSATVSQSSSAALHVSAGGTHVVGPGGTQVGEQVPVPVVPQGVSQFTVLPGTHCPAAGSSVSVSQSSSIRFPHSSIGGLQAVPAGAAQASVQAPVPVVPQTLVQDTVNPRMQPNPLSATVSQSSSIPLQTSPGAVQASGGAGTQSSPQVPAPGAPPHDVSHGAGRPAAHGKPLSATVSQSSSAPLHDSAGGVHSSGGGHMQSSLQVPSPVGPRPRSRSQVVSQRVGRPAAHTESSSVSVSQSLSSPSQPSGT